MENITNGAKWAIENKDTVLAWATEIISIASLIANFTPTDVDNKIISGIKKGVDILALNIKKNK